MTMNSVSHNEARRAVLHFDTPFGARFTGFAQTFPMTAGFSSGAQSGRSGPAFSVHVTPRDTGADGDARVALPVAADAQLKSFSRNAPLFTARSIVMSVLSSASI